jgi:hypothetical protein
LVKTVWNEGPELLIPRSQGFTDAIDAHGDYVVWMLQTMRERGARIVDVRKEPEDAYAEHCRDVDMATAPLRECIS